MLKTLILTITAALVQTATPTPTAAAPTTTQRSPDNIAGVINFSAQVTIEKAAEIGKKLAKEDPNFTHVTAFTWPQDNEANTSVLMFNYTKKNSKFIAAEKLGDAVKKKIDSENGNIVRAFHISAGSLEVK